jgi:hypothetical protein
MQRLLAPSLREKSNALNVARIALAGLDDMISGWSFKRDTAAHGARFLFSFAL